MPVFLICIHHFEAASPYLLHTFMFERKYGTLYGTIPVDLPSLDVAEKLTTKARWNTFEKFGFAFPEQIHEDEDYHTYYFSPFLRRQKTRQEKWNDYIYRGIEGDDDFYTAVEDGWEFQDADISVMTWDEAADEWDCVEVATARRNYENWKKSTDARQDNPDDHSFYFLRECEEIAAYILPPEPPANSGAVMTIQSVSEQTKTPVAPRHKEKAMKDVTEWLFAQARAVEIIIETFKKTGKHSRYTDLARQLKDEGWVSTDANRLNKDLGDQEVIRDFITMIKTRPKKTDTKKYEKWEQDFDERAKLCFERLVHGDREGLDAKACAEDYTVKKKLLLGEK